MRDDLEFDRDQKSNPEKVNSDEIVTEVSFPVDGRIHALGSTDLLTRQASVASSTVRAALTAPTASTVLAVSRRATNTAADKSPNRG
jgi:hypothetical protein